MVEGAQSFKTFCLAWVLLHLPLLQISWAFFWVYFFFWGGGGGGRIVNK